MVRCWESGSSVWTDCRVKKTYLVRKVKQNGSLMQLYDGVIETPDCLRTRGTIVSVVSNLAGWLANPLLESTGIGDYVSTTVTPRWGVPAKPQPHGVKKAHTDMCRSRDPSVLLQVVKGLKEVARARIPGQTEIAHQALRRRFCEFSTFVDSASGNDVVAQ